MAGQYVFHLQIPPNFDTDSLPIGQTPAVNTTGIDELTPDQFDSTII
jgi:hypothetical protein